MVAACLVRGRFGAVVDDLSAAPGEIALSVLDESGAILARANPLRVLPRDAALVHFWGDTHGQSDETLGTNSARDYFAFGRDKAHLDVMGHQGNDFQITGAFWQELNALTRALDVPGRFVCIPGYEWSANTAVGGDRNVHYRREGEALHRSSHAQIADATDMVDEATDAHTAHELFEKLTGKDCVVLAHVGGRYADVKFAHDGTLETAVEVHSAWGTFEWILHDAFEKNYRVGVMGNSDGHKGRPGACYPGASFFGSMGVAPPPSKGRVSSNPPHTHAGNLDNKELVAGTTLLIPVHVAGALFEVGDGHAAQGDGEVDQTAIETSLRGRLQLTVRKGAPLAWPRAETATHHITMGADENLTQATKIAIQEAVDFLSSTRGLTRMDAYRLVSIGCDVRVTQLVDGNVGVHVMIPKSLFAK